MWIKIMKGRCLNSSINSNLSEVHEALSRSGATNAAAQVAKDSQVAEDVKRRVELVIEAKEVW